MKLCTDMYSMHVFDIVHTCCSWNGFVLSLGTGNGTHNCNEECRMISLASKELRFTIPSTAQPLYIQKFGCQKGICGQNVL